MPVLRVIAHKNHLHVLMRSNLSRILQLTIGTSENHRYIIVGKEHAFAITLSPSLHGVLHLSQCSHHIHRVRLARHLLDFRVLYDDYEHRGTAIEENRLTCTRMNTL